MLGWGWVELWLRWGLTTAELLLIYANVSRTYVAWTNVIMMVGMVKGTFLYSLGSSSQDIPDMDKCCQDKCSLDKSHLTKPNITIWVFQSNQIRAPKLISHIGKSKPYQSIKSNKDLIKAIQVQACPELGTAQPQLVYYYKEYVLGCWNCIQRN